MGNMKTPGVYIVEKNAFPNSVVEVATAVPAFIGYTQTASKNNKSVLNKPIRVTSMAEFHNVFGLGPNLQFDFATAADAVSADMSLGEKHYTVEASGNKYRLYQSMQMFFLNGGGPCYIVSVGDYVTDLAKDAMLAGITTLIKEQEPTMVVIPDAVSLAAADCYTVQQQMLMHCGSKMRSRFALLDVHNGFQDKEDSVAAFRAGVPNKEIGDFGAAYFPWVNSTLFSDSDVNFNFLNDEGKTALQAALNDELGTPDATSDIGKMLAGLTATETAEEDPTPVDIDKALRASCITYPALIKEICSQLNLIPPSGAMAGLYTMTDNARGVWKAPANIGVLGVTSPAFEISDEEQESLNVDVNGKSINAIRSFIGEGTLVWGARTLDGNSLDWRYVNVRRTMIMLEQSVKLAAKAYVFEPNDAQTWVTIKSMISNFLTGIWKRGGLAGAVPADAFSVHVGLGETMTGEDILEGILKITVLVAITRPAEFIEITFQQQMQKS
ncbi:MULTISPECIES: phage tail sheath family protein [unclassified Agarivorans]|uniref:phage tail sheath family protein n=1 Tax=unclassified Agarivorans TaxID=2636026 RepID=UPI0026E39ACA|nr:MULTISPECIES: phage tail sheath C-terminal domain-containing protein [unclassified Agarivorans]MDO6686764.1 phage tail sheath C-terminal domain-containing protein [Agarivorans sp. 3_MG-2023]MDO6716506.1 phage tail sheath C-terminal domain-containing protein [Agarivorans sp. 2_MG-2023]